MDEGSQNNEPSFVKEMTAGDSESQKSSKLDTLMMEYLNENAVMKLSEHKMFGNTIQSSQINLPSLEDCDNLNSQPKALQI